MTSKNDDKLKPIRVSERVTIGAIKFLPGRVYRVGPQILKQLGKKAEPADG